MVCPYKLGVLSPHESGLSAPGLSWLIVPWQQALAGYATDTYVLN